MGNPQEQRWLSLDGIASVLRLPPYVIKSYVKRGFLVEMKGRIPSENRYLDPTPEYAEQLRVGRLIYDKQYAIPEGASEKALLTPAEISEILGFSIKKTYKWLYKYKPPSIRMAENMRLYTVAGIRECLWRREGRTLSKQRAPFLIAEMVTYFRKHYSEESALTPTDFEFRQDDVLHKKLLRLAKMDESARHDFAAKVELARKIVQILESSRRESDRHSSSCQSEIHQSPPGC